ncbi:hypothetical protein B0A49_01691 [Cryomyces minteri]|uniref:cyclin-dependent kinase n=1 Tax=Cryomyces minteri TaxID=331657 RepID=A0A4V5NHF7_9PEZI|nr:hypothetical protein B0A49_01691 [Cryomyces minteri]
MAIVEEVGTDNHNMEVIKGRQCTGTRRNHTNQATRLKAHHQANTTLVNHHQHTVDLHLHSKATLPSHFEEAVAAIVGTATRLIRVIPSGTADEEVDNPFRPSKDLRVEDETLKENNASPTNVMPPPIKAASGTSAQPESKISFAIKGKALEKPAATPKVDLLADAREDRRSEYQSSDFRSELTYKPEQRSSRREERPEKRPEPPRTVKVIRRRLKARPTLSADFTASDSVYYRKTGNESVVGSGTYGKVYKAIHVYTRDMVALKKIRMEGERDGFPVTAIREIKLLQSLNHDNVVKLQEVMVEKNDCFMVFEYLSHDLTGLLNHPTFQLSQAHKKHLAKQLFEGLDYLHRRGVLHRDIKAANILVSNTGQLKLADFGLARFYAKRQKLDYTNRVITIWYRSPELLLGETKYGPAVDIWSAACVLVEIFTKHAIFPGDGGEINQLDKIYNVLGTPTRAEWPEIVEMQWFELLRPAQRLPSTFAEKYRDRVTPEAFELLCAMFLYDPAARPSASDVLEHPYFTTEEPQPARAIELAELEGDWHEFESKALRKERDRVDREARRAARGEAEKRKTDGASVEGERDAKRARGEAEVAETEAQMGVEDVQLQE